MIKLFRKSKKGIMAFNMMSMIPRLIFLIAVLVVCILLISMFLNNMFNINDVQAEILVNGLLYGTGGINYYDPITGRIYPTMVDLGQLDNAELDAGMYYPDNTLITAIINIEAANRIENLAELYYNKQAYDNWEPLIDRNLPGIGGVAKYERSLPILVKNGSEVKLGQVEFKVYQPKSLRR
jgi:hypothetical protein